MTASEKTEYRYMTLRDLAMGILGGIQAGLYTGDEIFVASKDPEGNGFVAFESFVEEDATQIKYQGAPSWIEEKGWRLQLAETATDKPCVVLMSLYEIDPEF